MAKSILFVALLMIGTLAVKSQTASDSVKATISKLFAAMKNADSAGVMASFHPAAIMQTLTKTKEGKDTIRANTVEQFASSVGKYSFSDLDERIEFGAVQVDDGIAIVWAPYKFYFKQNFSHCGVNSFQLVRINDEWKIQYLIDTRRKTTCL